MKTKMVLVSVAAFFLFACIPPPPGIAREAQVKSAPRATANAARRCEAARMPGRDVGAKVNACDKELGAGAGEILLTGGGNISTQIIIGTNHTLRVMSGTYAASTDGAVIRLRDSSSLICDSWEPIIQESTGKLADTSPFTIVTPYNGASADSPNGALAQNIVVRGCHFKGARADFNSAPPTVALGNCRQCEASKNWLDATRTIGIQAGGGSASGQFASDVSINDNLLTQVASQNIAVTNADGGILVNNNVMRNLGQVGGPGVVPIDVEPNTGDRTRDLRITNNTIDASVVASSFPVQHGIVIQNGNAASPFSDIVVRDNKIIGAPHALAVVDNILYAGITVRTASNVQIVNNFVQRNVRGINVDYNSSHVVIEGNRLVSCGSGSTNALVIDGSSYVTVSRNILSNQPGDALNLPDAIVRSIVEMKATFATVDHNQFVGNDGNVSKVGANSRIVAR